MVEVQQFFEGVPQRTSSLTMRCCVPLLCVIGFCFKGFMDEIQMNLESVCGGILGVLWCHTFSHCFSGECFKGVLLS